MDGLRWDNLTRSLSLRATALGTLVGACLAFLIVLLFSETIEMRNSLGWVSRSQQVIQTIGETTANMHAAEAGQRGFLLSRNPAFIDGFSDRLTNASAGLRTLRTLTTDNPVQHGRAAALQAIVERRISSLRAVVQMGQQGQFDDAVLIVSSARGRDLMDKIDRQADEMMATERDLLATRGIDADRGISRSRRIIAIGGPVIFGLLVMLIAVVIGGIRRPMRAMLDAMGRLGAGDDARIEGGMGSTEFQSLAAGYNRMADRLVVATQRQRRSDEELHAANVELRARGEVLQARGEVIELLGGMAHRMQAARTDDELAEVIRRFVPRVLPGVPGALYTHNNSRNLLVCLARWGAAKDAPDSFAPDSCWALRRGQSHIVTAPGTDIICAHIGDPQAVYQCEPMLAGGELIGMLYLEGIVGAESRFRLNLLEENIASALVNHRLQRGLREQTIRDPLTTLFNRRYMEETLTLEIARTMRDRSPLALVMCDVDHFKRFNDEFGHDAGDTLLQALAAEMRSHFRDGDVVCRYGGEEFIIIAPGSTPVTIAARIDRLRIAISEMAVRQLGRPLGSVSMSFGIASWQDHMDNKGQALIKVADMALYRAKGEGRNRAIVADQLAA